MVKQKHIIYFILIAAAIVAIFLYNPWLLYFQNDDMSTIPLSRDKILFQHNSFRPICDISLIMDYKLWGKNAWGYHLSNLIFHFINTVLVFVITKKSLKKYKLSEEPILCSFTTAVLFWIYMNHSEAVFWILGRSAMIGMLFFLLAVFFYLKRYSSFKFFLSIFFSLLAWLSYESTFILLPVFFLISMIDVKSHNTSWKPERKFLIIILLFFIGYCCYRLYFMGMDANYYNSNSNQSTSFTFLIGSLCRLAIRSWLPPSQSKILLVTEFVALIILAILFVKKNQNKKLNRAVIVLLMLWMISLLPYINLSIDTKGVESERFMYLPSFFVCFCITTLLFQLQKNG